MTKVEEAKKRRAEYSKARREANAKAQKCINTPKNKEHGPIYKHKRCKSCYEVKVKSDTKKTGIIRMISQTADQFMESVFGNKATR